MTHVAVAGVGMTRFAKMPDRGMKDLAGDAIDSVLSDAGVRPSDIEQIFFANAIAGLITGQEMVRGHVALRDRGLEGIPMVNVENACASSSTAFALGCQAIESGRVDMALVIGAEKMTHPDRQFALQAIGTAADVERMDEELDSGDSAASSGTRSPFMDLYARLAGDYLESSDATEVDLAQVAVKNHAHGSHNPLAQYGSQLTVDEVLAARQVSGPLTLYMCAPVSDGAAAALLVSQEHVKRFGIRQPVAVRASSLVSGAGGTDLEPAQSRASRRALREAGLRHEDIDLLEVHDATAVAELIAYEELGFVGRGEGAGLLRSGATGLGGHLPVNPSGGLMSRGHPIGATGLAQIVELVEQLRGRSGERQVPGAQVGMASNEGGWLGNDVAVCAVHILSRLDG